MDDLTQAFHTLGLQPEATQAEVRQAYRDLVNVWHPDRFAHDERLQKLAQEKLKEINGAQELLKAHFFAAGTVLETPPTTEPPPPAPEPTAKPRPLWFAVGLGLLVAVIALAVVAKKFSASATTASTEPPAASRTNFVAASPTILKDGQLHALMFSGTDSCVTLAPTGSLGGTFTVECWAMTRVAAGQKAGTIISSLAPQDFGFNLKFRQGKRIHGDIGDGARWLLRDANARFPDRYRASEWHHVAYVVTPEKFTAYLDGQLTEQGNLPAGRPVLCDAQHRLMLGADEKNGDLLRGGLAEIRIWETARTADAIVATMKTTLTGREPGLRGYWRLDETNGTQLLDASGHGFTGQIFGDVSRGAMDLPK
jgi:hypothetical protein